MNRKIIVLIFCLAIFYNSSFAQFFSKVGITTVLPLNYFNTQVDFGYGPHLNIGYCITNNLDVALAFDYLFYSAMIPDFQIISASIMIKYKVHVGKYAPYLGLKPGIYQSRSKPYKNEIISNNAFGFAPLLGVQIDTGISNKLKFDISTSVSTPPTPLLLIAECSIILPQKNYGQKRKDVRVGEAVARVGCYA